MLWDFNRNTVVITHSCVDAQINRQLKLQEDHVGPEDEVNKAMVMFIEVKERRETRDWVDWSECIALQLHQEHVKQVSWLSSGCILFLFCNESAGRVPVRFNRYTEQLGSLLCILLVSATCSRTPTDLLLRKCFCIAIFVVVKLPWIRYYITCFRFVWDFITSAGFGTYNILRDSCFNIFFTFLMIEEFRYAKCVQSSNIASLVVVLYNSSSRNLTYKCAGCIIPDSSFAVANAACCVIAMFAFCWVYLR